MALQRCREASCSHAMEDGPDCLKFYTNDTYFNKIRRFSSSLGVPPGFGVNSLCTALQIEVKYTGGVFTGRSTEASVIHD